MTYMFMYVCVCTYSHIRISLYKLEDIKTIPTHTYTVYNFLSFSHIRKKGCVCSV